VGHVDPLLAAACSHQERHPKRVGDRQSAHVEVLAVAGAEAEAAAALAEHFRKDATHVGEGLMAASTLVLGSTKAARLVAIEAARRNLLAGGVDLTGIVATALFGIRQDVVGLRDLLELGFGCLVAGFEVGLIFLGGLGEAFADPLIRRGLRPPQNNMGIGHNPANVRLFHAVASPRPFTASAKSRYLTLSTDHSRAQFTRSPHGSLSLP